MTDAAATLDSGIDSTSRVFISLGSNLEPRLEHLQDALDALYSTGTIVKVSSVYETAPVGYSNQPDFLNAAIELETSLHPMQLLRRLKELEGSLGRKARPRWHEREIDFDILFFDGLILTTAELTIPHPEIASRLFVLAPLCDIDANFVHPVLNQRVSEMYSKIERSASVIRKTAFTLAI